MWVDAIKGLAIILVVFGHTWRSCELAGVFKDAPQGLFSAVDTRIYAFHMPLFFMASGFFVLESLRRSTGSAFILSRLKRLIWPLFLWSYIFIASKLAVGSLANDPLHLDARMFVPIPAQWQFWFLWSLFVMHMGLLLLRPALLSERFERMTLWGLLLVNFAILTQTLPFSVYFWTNNAPHFMPFLLLGMLMTSYGMLRASTALPGLLALGAAILLIAAVPSIPTIALSKALLSGAICLAIVVALSWLIPALPKLGSVLGWFGGASMIIFLSHTLFAAPMRMILLKADILSLPVHIGLGTIAGMLGPFGLLWLIKRSGRSALFGI